MDTRPCGYCSKPSKVLVTYFLDGNGSRLACGQHIGRAVDEVYAGSTVPSYASLKIRPQNPKD